MIESANHARLQILAWLRTPRIRRADLTKMRTSNQKHEQLPAICSARPTLHASSRRSLQNEEVIGNEQLFINVMRDLGWGRIENVPVRGGIPKVTKDTKVLRLVRDGRNETALASCWHHRKLHQQHHNLLADCKRIDDGVLERIEVSDGLPIHWKRA
jgi:hypothetical protein